MTAPQASGHTARTLSERQRAVIDGLLKGLTNKEIANELCVSEQCVKYHVAKLFVKFGVDSRVTLALAAERQVSGADRIDADGLGRERSVDPGCTC